MCSMTNFNLTSNFTMITNTPAMKAIRQVSASVEEDQSYCWCGERIESKPGHLRLGCRCVVHYDCLVELIKSWTNINQVQEWGVCCPYMEGCAYKSQYGRTFYITEDYLDSLLAYGETNKDTVGAVLSERDIEKFRRIQEEKCIRLSCGCYIRYHELVGHVRLNLDTCSVTPNQDGIMCPNKALGTCRGIDGIYLSRFDVSVIICTGADVLKRRLLPAFSPRSEPQHLTLADSQHFDRLYDRHVQFGCECFVHIRTAVASFRSSLSTQGTAACASNLNSGHSEKRNKNIVLSCPHRQFCTHSLNSTLRPVLSTIAQPLSSTDMQLYYIKEDDIDRLVECQRRYALRNFEDSFLVSATPSTPFDLMDNGLVPEVELHEQRKMLHSWISNPSRKDCLQDDFDTSVRRGFDFACMYLLLQGADPYKEKPNGSAALHSAAAYGHCGIISVLLENCVDPNYRDHTDKSALDNAARYGCIDAVTTLLDYHMDVHSVDKRGRTALFHAAKGGHKNIVMLLLERGADMHVKCVGGRSPLLAAMEAGHEDVAQILSERIADTKIASVSRSFECFSSNDIAIEAQARNAYDGRDDHTPPPPPSELVKVGEDLDDLGELHNLHALIGSAYIDDAASTGGMSTSTSVPLVKVGVFPLHAAIAANDEATALRLLETPYHHSFDCNERAKSLNSRTPLHMAALVGNTTIAARLTSMGANANFQDKDGNAPLHVASHRGDLPFVSLLLQQANIECSIQNKLGQAPLHIAASKGNKDIVEHLLDCRPMDCNLQDGRGNTPLHEAVVGCHMDVVSILLSHGADFTVVDDSQQTPLHLAVKSCRMDIISMLVDAGSSCAVQAQGGLTPLHLAARSGRVDIVAKLIDCNSFARAATACNTQCRAGKVPLHIAAEVGNSEMMLTLIGARSDCNVQMSNGWTALHITARNDDVMGSSILLTNGADRNAQARDGQSPVHAAAGNGAVNAMAYLLTRGARLDLQDKHGATALHAAIEGGHIVATSLLLTRGANCNVTDNNGNTPLHRAVNTGGIDVDLIKLLLNRGADCNRQDESGKSALHGAALSGRADVALMLIQAGADSSLMDKNMRTARDIAELKGNLHLLPLLIEAPSSTPGRSLGAAAAAAGASRSSTSSSSDTGSSSSSSGGDGVDGGDSSPVHLSLLPPSAVLTAHNEYMLTEDEIHALKALCRESALELQQQRESQQEKVPCIQPSSLSSPPPPPSVDPESQFIALRNATSKKCPECGYHQTHYHGHHCHHVREGCFKCKTHFCYRCLGTAAENLQLRGSENCCKCGGWSSYCQSEDLPAHLCLHPYPHDSRCGCPICPECRPGNPCQGCSGDCVVCRDLIKPGPAELTLLESVSEIQTEQQRQRQEVENKRSQLLAASRSGDVNAVRMLLPGFALEACVDDTGMTPLHWASLCGHPGVVQQLIRSVSSEVRPTLLSRCCDGGYNALHYACQEGHLEIVVTLIFYGATINQCDAVGIPPVLIAGKYGHLSIVALLLRAGGTGLTLAEIEDAELLHRASQLGYLEFVEAFLEKGADINQVSIKNHDLPLHHACAGGHAHIVAHLLQSRSGGTIEFDGKNKAGETPLHKAAQAGSAEAVIALLDAGVQIDATTLNGNSALSLACGEGHMDVVICLLDRGAPLTPPTFAVNIMVAIYQPRPRAPRNLVSPIHRACENGHVNIINLLLDRGEDVESSTFTGESPLVVAIKNGHIDAVRLLLDRGATLKTATAGGTSKPALHVAARAGCVDIATLLLERDGSQLNAIAGVDGSSALHLAADDCQLEMVEFLLRSRASVHVEDAAGYTALHRTVMNARLSARVVEVVEILLRYGANVNHRRDTHLEPILMLAFDYLSENRLVDVIRLFLGAGADINITNLMGQTPLHRACKSGYRDIVRLLLQSGADVDLIGGTGQTPLGVTLIHAPLQAEIVCDLLSYGATFDATKSLSLCQGRTLPAWAIDQGHAGVIGALLARGMDTNCLDEQGNTLLQRSLDIVKQAHVQERLDEHVEILLLLMTHVDCRSKLCTALLEWAIKQSQLRVLQALVERGVDIRSHTSFSPLKLALAYGNPEIIGFLLDQVSDEAVVDSRTIDWVMMHFRHAVECGVVEIVSSFMGHGATIDTCDKAGSYPLHWAAEKGKSNVVAFFADMGCPIDRMDKDGQSALHHAAREGHSDTVAVLINRGADVNMQSRKGHFTPLHLAAEAGHTQAISILLTANASIDAQDRIGWSSLHVASRQGHTAAVTALLTHPAASHCININLQSKAGETSLFLACHYGTDSVVRILLESGGDVSIRNCDGITPMQAARQADNHAVIKVFEKLRTPPTTASKSKSGPRGRKG